MESEPLIANEAPSSPERQASIASTPSTDTNSNKSVLLRLYTSHTLSTWNSRMFEFGAVVFLASIYHDTLLYASIYALVRSLFAVLLSSWLGTVVDRVNRLVAIRHSIIWQRLPVAVSCICLGVLLTSPPTHLSWILFVTLVLLAGIEKLASTANTVAVERDWAVVISDSLNVPRKDLNAQMRRIDLFCKLVAPVAVSLMDGLLSTRVAIWGVLGINVAVVFVEYLAIAQVYTAVPELDRKRDGQAVNANTNDQGEHDIEDQNGSQGEEPHGQEQRESTHFLQTLSRKTQSTISPWKEYTRQPVFLASLSLSLLYLNVLSFGPTMVTFLLHSGFTSLQVSAMRIGAVLAEISGTVVAPFLMDLIGPIRSGLWFLNWQFLTLAGVVAAFIFQDDGSINKKVVAGILVAGVALSRLGLWGFDLSVQLLVQEGIPEHTRSSFSATEMALQSVFEMVSFATTIIFAAPEQFKYPAYISYGAIAVATACFAAYVRRERGHLLHGSKCMGDVRL
ncbi:Ferroporti-1 [Aspergillus filifer]